MKGTPQMSMDELLANPKVREFTESRNQALRDRIEEPVPKCAAFRNGFTRLVETDKYVFQIDREAERELPEIINNKVQIVELDESPEDEQREYFSRQRNIGLVFSGGPAPGGHNVIAGIFDSAKAANPETRVFGFLLGPDGILESEYIEIDRELVDNYRNLGGFGMINTGRTKIDSAEKMKQAKKTCKDLGLEALVVIGGDDSNTNAAFLAQEMFYDGVQVIGVPKTIDGDIQVRDANGEVLCAVSFGFHTAARAFATEVANLCTDASSDVKYWHICKVMGRVASHLALEVALQAHPNMTLIGEDLADYIDKERLEKARRQGQEVDYTAFGMTLRHLSRVICDGIVRRAAVGKNYGVMVIPEGVLEFINEIQVFIIKLNTILADYNSMHDTDFHQDFVTLDDKLDYLRRLARRSREDKTFTVWNTRDDDLFNDIPAFFQEGLLMERDSHGNFPFSQVETDKVIMGLVKDYLKVLSEQGIYRVGIHRDYFRKTLEHEGLEPDFYGPVIFKNYDNGEYLLMIEDIISHRTLKTTLERAGAISEEQKVPHPVQKIFKQSIPRFKTQTHFYGYDGRGSDPTRFDCMYTYNLGCCVFSLIANGATGQMAAIQNLEQDFDRWQPLGVPIAPLMHLEERKGKLALVLERTVVDLNSAAFKIVEANREKWLAAKPRTSEYRRPVPIHHATTYEHERPITLILNSVGKGEL
ncbi:MAG: 6-phosphofructokinase [Desulfatibacillaceae bacterium]